MSDERLLLEAAQAGDEDAFASLVGPFSPQLRAHCYRMLGSVADAEGALQETLLRAWSGLGRFESRTCFAPGLSDRHERQPAHHREAAQACAPDRLRPRGRPTRSFRRAATESVWLEPYPDAQLGGKPRCSARTRATNSVRASSSPSPPSCSTSPHGKRAVLILRDVLGFSARETAEALETTPVPLDSALQEGPQGDRGVHTRPHAPGDAAGARGRRAAPDRRPASPMPGNATTSMPSSR